MKINLAEKKYLVYPSGDKFLVWEFDMERVDGMPLYWLAQSIGQLYHALNEPSATLPSIANAAKNADYNLDKFISDSVGLTMSKDAAKSILWNLRELFKNRQPSIPGVADPLISNDEKNTVFSPIWDFQAVLGSELPQLNIFFVTQHRDRDMNLLINSGEMALSQKTLSSLSSSRSDVVREIREAARSLAFSVPTAVGLHLCRAVEVIITKEYFPSLGIKLPKNRNLGQYLKSLVENGQPNPRVISKLRDFKDYYRNVITHPEEFWDIDNADSAFGTAINVIDAIVRDIEAIRAKQAAP